MSNLGAILGTKYILSRDQDGLNKAINWTEQALAALPADHPYRPLLLCNLADDLGSREYSTNEFYRILGIYYKVWHCHTTLPALRIKVASIASRHLIKKKMWEDASALLEGAIKLLPKLSPRSLQRGDQEFHLSSYTQIPAETLSIAFQAGEDAAHCLRLLELGRGIIMGLVIDCRSSFPGLQPKDSELFNKFNRLRTELDCPLSIQGQKSSGSAYLGSRDRQAQAAQSLDETLASIQELPGFEGFQRPPRSEDLMEMAGDGSIVIVNSTATRSDAILVTRTRIKALPLPLLSYTLVQQWMSEIPRLVCGRPSTYASRNEIMESLLLWLWDKAVEPILGELQLLVDGVGSPGALPRIWWIGVGLLATAPFHAAGDHSRGSTRNTLSRAISSYIPTIKALSYAREKELELLNKPDSRILLVAMPTTPENRDLKNAPKEVDKIVETVERVTKTTRLDSPSTAQVLVELPSHHAVHFACHGLSDARSPSDSYLLLRKDDGSECGIVDKLTVGMISDTNIMKHAQIAYLPACCTTQNASDTLANEPTYTASGFQLAGFSHVLATQ